MIQNNQNAKPEPEFPRYLFKDLYHEPIDWEKSYRYVIRNIIENGGDDDWEELFRYYGHQKVKRTIMNEIPYMPEYTMDRVCEYFQIKPEELFCYRRLQLRLQGIFLPDPF